MFRRWLIRGLALTLLTLCVVAWVGSYWRQVGLKADSADKVRLIFFNYGSLAIRSMDWGAIRAKRGLPPNDEPLHFVTFVADADAKVRAGSSIAGFAYGTMGPLWVGGAAVGWEAYVPLYFPTLLSALLLWLVWRKTKTKYSGKAFPVETANDA